MGAYDSSADLDSDLTMVQAISFLALAYMTLCTYWALFRINIGWGYRLQGIEPLLLLLIAVSVSSN